MAIQLLDLDGLAQASVEGDLDAFVAASAQLGWTLTEPTRQALLRAVEDTNYHRWYSFGVNGFTVAQAIGLLAEAASNASGIAITEQVRSLGLGKEIAIAFRDDAHIHFGVRYASNLPMTPSHLWAELKPWYKVLERNRPRLATWAAAADGIVSVPLAARHASAAESGEALLAAVIAEPDDVDRRLVYADWLVAQGDAQGELIQLCERRRVHQDSSLDARIKELEAAYGERIAGEVAQLASAYTLARGFVKRIEMPAPTFAKHGERLFASHPIEQLDLKPVNDEALARLARVPALARVRVLYLSQIIGRTRAMSFDDLCRSPHFAALRRLEVWTWKTGGKPRDAFARLQAPRLQSMFLWQVDSAPRIIAGLAGNESVQLRELEVSMRERESWAPSLFGPAFERLERLRLDVRGQEVAKLFDGASLPMLTSLELGADFPLEQLHVPSLRRLRGETISASGFARLLERHPRLEALWIDEMDPKKAKRAFELALALPSEHPLVSLHLGREGVDEELQARVAQRFAREYRDVAE
jgi:uncharacterized protein (TIGR02996 family)